MADIFDRCIHFRDEQRITSKDDLSVAERVLFDVLPIQNAGPWFQMNGNRFLQFSTNDYLGISVRPEVRGQAAEMAERFGISAPMGARPLTGTCELHLELEEKVAAFKRVESAVIFSTGAGAMMGVIGGLAKPGDLIIMDQLVHASLICGAKISGASIKYFRHNDRDNLERVLKLADPKQAKLIVVDGVYSMNGDISHLKEICDLRDMYGARLLVDDAHGNGVCGPTGRGVAELLDVEQRIDIHAGTFSKAFGTSGGFITGEKSVMFYIRSLSPSLLFTKAPSAVVTAATLKAVDLVDGAAEERTKLWQNASYLQKSLQKQGFDIGETRTPITPISLGGNRALYVADILRRKHNIFVSAVLYPAIRRGSTILRIVPTALHTSEDIDRLVRSIVTSLTEANEKLERAGGDAKSNPTIPPQGFMYNVSGL